jgi:membrane protein implicated in regulation of membrane protease activity
VLVTTFLVLGVVGLLLLVASLVLGDVIDGVDLGPDWLSGTAVAAFLAAVGFAGALALQAGLGTTLATAVGVGAGLAAGVLAGALTRSLTREADDVTPRSGALLGSTATVVSDVPADGYGTVSLVVAGHPTRLNARASTGLRTGQQVRVSAVLSSTAVQVEPLTASGDAGIETTP